MFRLGSTFIFSSCSDQKFMKVVPFTQKKVAISFDVDFIKIEQRIPTKIILDPNQESDKLLAGMNVMVHVKK